MNPKDFEQLCEVFRHAENKIMGHKRGEYATTTDRLQNFREVADFTGSTMPKVALCWLMKHIHSIKNAVETGNYKWFWMTEDGNEGLKQRIADARNYLLLLAACLDEEASTGAGEQKLAVTTYYNCQKCANPIAHGDDKAVVIQSGPVSVTADGVGVVCCRCGWRNIIEAGE